MSDLEERFGKNLSRYYDKAIDDAEAHALFGQWVAFERDPGARAGLMELFDPANAKPVYGLAWWEERWLNHADPYRIEPVSDLDRANMWLSTTAALAPKHHRPASLIGEWRNKDQTMTFRTDGTCSAEHWSDTSWSVHHETFDRLLIRSSRNTERWTFEQPSQQELLLWSPDRPDQPTRFKRH